MAREAGDVVDLRRGLGAKLRGYRRAAGMTQVALSALLFCDRTTLAHIEGGRARADRDFWQRADRAVLAQGELVLSFEQVETARHEHRLRESRRRLASTTAALAVPRTPGDAVVEVWAESPHNPHEVGLAYSPSLPATVETVGQLGRQDIMERRKFLGGALYVAAAAVAPSQSWLLATLDDASTATGKVNNAQVAAIRKTFGRFQELDVMKGGGHARHRLARYLINHVVPLLRDNDPQGRTGASLYEAASEQLYLLGWMAFDSGEHDLAQRYLIQALRLAQASNSVELGAHVLAGLSDQATFTGNPLEGIKLARAGRAGLSQGRSLACEARLCALQARAEATLGRDVEAQRNIMASQRAFDGLEPSEEPEWARFIDQAYLNGEYANAFRDLGDHKHTAEFAELSIEDAQRQGRGRREAFGHAAAARAALDARDLEAASASAINATTLSATVDSSRSQQAISDLTKRLTPHKGSRAVQDFIEVSETLMPTGAGL